MPGTQKMRRLRQDATPADQTQGPFLLMLLRPPVPTTQPPPPVPALSPEGVMDTSDDPGPTPESPLHARILFPATEPETPRPNPTQLLAPPALQASVRFSDPTLLAPVSSTSTRSSSRASAH